MIPISPFSTLFNLLPKGENLKKYSLDLTARAEEGKLDPVIGRDEEVRRTLQVKRMREFVYFVWRNRLKGEKSNEFIARPTIRAKH